MCLKLQQGKNISFLNFIFFTLFLTLVKKATHISYLKRLEFFIPRQSFLSLSTNLKLATSQLEKLLIEMLKPPQLFCCISVCQCWWVWQSILIQNT